MNIDLSLAEIKAVAAALETLVDGDSRLMTAWLKLVSAQAAGLAVPEEIETFVASDGQPALRIPHSPPRAGTADSVPAPMPGVTRMGAGTLSFDTWGLR